MTRVAVFMDYQNVYMGARGAFDLKSQGHIDGQVYPRRTGLLVVDRGRTMDPARELISVNVYRGEPSPKHSPKGQAACQRQVRYWESQTLVRPVTRPLKYYWRGQDRWGNDIYEPHEKGIDVRIALDVVIGAIRDEYDVCILFSADTDLLPALEEVRALGKRCEVAAWKSPYNYSSRLTLPGLWCHWLDDTDYTRVADPTDYTVEVPHAPTANP